MDPYYCIIPESILSNNKLSDKEKLLYAKISNLTVSSGECFATNSYFAKYFGVTKETISRRINTLQKHGYIKINIIRNNKNEVIKRIILLNTPIDKNINTLLTKTSIPIDKNIKENNKTFNNKNNNNIKATEKQINYVKEVFREDISNLTKKEATLKIKELKKKYSWVEFTPTQFLYEREQGRVDKKTWELFLERKMLKLPLAKGE